MRASTHACVEVVLLLLHGVYSNSGACSTATAGGCVFHQAWEQEQQGFRRCMSQQAAFCHLLMRRHVGISSMST